MTPRYLCSRPKKNNCRVQGCRAKTRRIFQVGGVGVRLCSAHEVGEPAIRVEDLKRVQSEPDVAEPNNLTPEIIEACLRRGAISAAELGKQLDRVFTLTAEQLARRLD